MTYKVSGKDACSVVVGGHPSAVVGLLYGMTLTGSCDTAGATVLIKLRRNVFPPELGTSMMSLGSKAMSSARFFSIAVRSTTISLLVDVPASCLTILTLSFLLSCLTPHAMATARERVIGSLSGMVTGVNTLPTT